MGEHEVELRTDATRARAFTRALLRDLHALERMLDEGRVETGVHRIGAEQELFLVDDAWRPACRSMEILERIADPAYTTELGRFNLEINLEPMEYGGDCLSRLEGNLAGKIRRLAEVARELGARPVLVGILPTLRQSDLTLGNMTPRDRYHALNEALNRASGGRYQCRLKGMDELFLEHDSVMLEAACTSFQVHMQVGPEEFPAAYNAAQAAVAPVLAVGANSPLLFGRRLWRESRIPLFQQSLDTRDASYHLRERRPRVCFGSRWVDDSVLELFQQDIGRFRVLVATEVEEDPFALLRRGAVPGLRALQVHNGTVYRWNRPCYGITAEEPHLRIEMRALPSGPTVVDEVAGAAFFYGLLDGLRMEVGDVADHMEFHRARSNFGAAAELGLDAQFRWLDDRLVPAQELICKELVPLARQGLDAAGIATADAERYLGIIEERAATGRTGASWLLGSFNRLVGQGTREEILTALTATCVARQAEEQPVHRWPLAELEEGMVMAPEETRVEEFMTTDVFTVDPDEPVSLVAHLMEWRHVRHMPVEDEQGRLVGLVSVFGVVRQVGERPGDSSDDEAAVRDVMTTDPVTVTPETSMLEAIRLLREEDVDCLPVVREGRLVGIVTEHDFIRIVARLLEERES